MRGTLVDRPMRDPAGFVAPFPLRYLPIPLDVATRLTALGYSTVGEVAKLPLEVLRAQFGELAFEIERSAQGGGHAEVEAVYPTDCLAERFHFVREFQPTMSPARARQAAEKADRAAYAEAVSSYANLDRDELRSAALSAIRARDWPV